MKNTHQEEVLGKLQKIENLLKTKKLKPFNSEKASQYLVLGRKLSSPYQQRSI
ncbi:MAG: hypothetical protein L3J08_09230 [Flavobacteriaceae bacterium]|nr:hypothetical protein [Flavobacteriaceae bacterium]